MAVSGVAAANPNPPLLTSPPPFSWAAVVSGKTAGAPSSPRAVSKSFQDVVLQNGPVKQKNPSSYRGEPAVFFTNEEIAKLASPFRYTLVGKFSYHRPSMDIIRKFFISLGLKSLQSVGLLQDNHIAIFITKEEDYTRLLMRATWYISGTPMKVIKWCPDFFPNIESPIVPVWIGLPGLPLHFFEKSALFCIASVFGTPLKIDEPTAKLSRPTVARICVEVDVSQPRNHRIWLGDERDGYWQDVIFENPPKYCAFCQVLGHDSTSCIKKHPTLLKEQKKNLGLANTKTEENRTAGPMLKTTTKEKTNITWKRREVNTTTDEKKDAEGWFVVGGKKKNKNHSVPVVEMSKPEEIWKGNVSSASPVKLLEAVVPPEEKLRLLLQNNEVKGGVVPVSSSPSLPAETLQLAVALTPFPDIARVRRKMGNGNERYSAERNMTDLLTKVQSQSCISNSIEIRPLDSSAAITDERLKASEKQKLQVQKMVIELQDGPSDQKATKGRDSSLILVQSDGDNNERQLDSVQALDEKNDKSAVREATVAPETLQKNKGKNKIQPLDGSIKSQPIVEFIHGLNFGNSETGCKMGLEKLNGSPKGFGNLGFEFFKGPSPNCRLDQDAGTGSGKYQLGHPSAAGPSSAGLNTGCGLGDIQQAGRISGTGPVHARVEEGNKMDSPQTAGPLLLNNEELGSGLCQLNQMDSAPSAQFNSQQKIPSEDLSDEDEENNSSEDSNYFGIYHSDGDFPEDSDWYSSDSESAKFLKGKWRRGYTLRANFSRSSLG